MGELTLDQQRAVAIATARRRQAGAAADVRGTGGGRGTGLEAALIGARQGVTLGFGDEINAGVRAAGDYIGGKPLGESYDKRLAHEKALLDQTRKEDGGAMLAGEIGGTLMIPGGAAGTATTVGGAAARGAAAGGLFGGVAGAGNAEPGSRVEGAAKGAAWGSLFGVGAGTAVSIGTKGFRRIMGQVAEKPTIEGLRHATKLAYKAVDDAGETFAPAEMQAMAKAAREAVEGTGTYVPETDLQTKAALTVLDLTAQRPQTLTQLDNIRKSLWKRYNAAPNEPGILDAIDAIDDLVQSRASSSGLMNAARLASAMQKKSELLHNAFKKATDQTKSAGSGGNILNKYRQAVTKVINDTKQAKWFNADEIATMQKVIDGSVSENILRRVGKISPSGNGLMMFLNIMGGATMGPSFLPVTALGVGAKAIADRSAGGNVDALMGKVMGATPAPQLPVAIPGAVGRVSGYLGSK